MRGTSNFEQFNYMVPHSLIAGLYGKIYLEKVV
jgi:hypothetical protein